MKTTKIEKALDALETCVDVGFSHIQDRSWGELNRGKASTIIRSLLQSHKPVVTRKEIEMLYHKVRINHTPQTQKEINCKDISGFLKSKGFKIAEK